MNIECSSAADGGGSADRILARGGYGIVEMIVAMALAGLIATLATSLIVMQARLLVRGATRVESLDALRTATLLMPIELRAHAMPDLYAVGGDSAAIRAFRGTGLVCDVRTGASSIRYRGWRDPDATKDSVLIVTRVPEHAAAIAAVSHGGSCTALPGETILDIALGADSLQLEDVVLVFEPGAYHLSTGALRYRAPGGTRQPLTADVLRGAGFGLLMRTPPGPVEPLAVDLAVLTVSRTPLVSPSITAQRIRVPLLNASAPPDSSE
jgi:hypothetical protein